MISPQGTTLTFAAVAFPAAAAEQALSLLPLRRRRQRHLRPSPTLPASSSRLNTIAPERLPRKPRLLSMSYSEVCIEEYAQKGLENSAIPKSEGERGRSAVSSFPWHFIKPAPMKTELEFNLRLTWKETTPRRAASPQNKAARPRRRATGSCHGVAEEEERRDTSSAVTTSEIMSYDKCFTCFGAPL